jgi:hypothetical protein
MSVVCIFTQARKIYDAHNDAQEKVSSGNSWKGFTEASREKRMKELDNQFYQEPRQRDAFLDEYLRSRRDLFTK